MAHHVDLNVQLIACTEFTPPMDVEWTTDAEGGEALIEFAGRACYESFDKPNPRTATNEAYLRHIMEVGHTALLEHASATMFNRGIGAASSLFVFAALAAFCTPGRCISDCAAVDPRG